MININIDKYKRLAHMPTKIEIMKFAKAALGAKYVGIALDLLIVNKTTSQELNLEYRGKDAPTNVISLEYAQTRDEFNILNGEVILCDDIICEEAAAQNKSIVEHYAHMIVHGVLHIQGFDHLHDEEAQIMEDLEVQILASLGFANPYLEQ